MFSIRKISGTRPVVLLTDPALDLPQREAFKTDEEHKKAVQKFVDEKWVPYLKAYDISLLPVLPGAKLSVFYVAPLTSEQCAAIEDAKHGPGGEIRVGSYARELIAYGVHDVAIEQQNEDGSSEPYPLKRVKGALGLRLPEDLLVWIMRQDDVREALFGAVRRATSLDPEAAKSR